MKRIIVFMVVIGFCFGLLAQPKAFDPDYYMDTLKVKKSDEFKKLENYREKYKSLGLPLTGTGYAYGYPSFYADWFYHRGINLDRIHEYKKLGFFNSNTASDIYTDIYSNIFRPIIVIAKLSSFERAFYDDIATFDVISIIKGKEFYEKFPSSIKCYSPNVQGYFMDVLIEGKNVSFVKKPRYFGKCEPASGDEFILFLDQFRKDNIDLFSKSDKSEFNKIDVFFAIEAEYLDYSKTDDNEKNKSRGQVELDKLLDKLKKIDELKKED